MNLNVVVCIYEYIKKVRDQLLIVDASLFIKNNLYYNNTLTHLRKILSNSTNMREHHYVY